MRLIQPYLAIIVDSFHSALASRVLWAAMLAIWLLLGSLAPIGLREDYTTKFRWFDVYNGTRMKALLAQGMVDPDSTDQAIGRVAAAMPDEMKRKLKRVGEGDEVRIRLSLLTDALNDLVDSDSSRDKSEEGWYDAQAWKPTVRLRELRELDEKRADELSESLRERRARLRLEAALPGVFEARGARSVLLTYAGLDFPTEFQVDRVQFETIFNQFVIPILVNWLLGLVLVFLGVLVTASIVPDMLQTGSLHLLLSKPISRWALLVSKFIGGCAFVLLCVTQLVIGLYLIAALRLGVWNGRILWCIPVALLIFAVFYSVSVLAGLKWRSAIISIAAAGGLAAICTVVGIIGGVVDARVVQPDRITSMTMAGDDLFAVTGGSGLVRMNVVSQSWDSVIDGEAMSNDRVLPPVALDNNRLLTARIRNGRFNPFGSGSLDLIALSRTEDWKPQPTLRLPTATERLFVIGDQVAAANTADLLVTDRDSIATSLSDPTTDEGEEKADETETKKTSVSRQPGANSVGGWLRALVTMQGGATEDFTSILPTEISLSPPARITPVDDGAAFILLTGNRLFRIEPAAVLNQPWNIVARKEFETNDDRSDPVLAASSRYVLIARGDSPMKILDSTTLEEVGTWNDADRQLIAEGTPIELTPLMANQFLYRTTSGHADLIEIEAGASSELLQVVAKDRLSLDEIETIHFDPGSKIIVAAHDIDRVSRFQMTEPGQFEFIEIMQPPRSVWRWIDYYVIGGLEWLTPQVLQLGDTTAAMVSGNQSMVIGGGNWGDVEVVRYKIMRPLVNCLMFIAVVMGLACWYFSRTDY